MNKVGLILVFVGLIVTQSVYSQRGKIIKAGDPIMDFGQDGYISKTTAGFSSRDYNVPEFDRKMFGIPKVGGDVTGDNVGKSCGITDLIPDSVGYPVYAVRLNDANNNLIFRFRVGDDNPSVEAWTILLDTDGLFGVGVDPNATANNPGFEIDITLIKNKNKGVFVYNIDGIENCPTAILNYSFDTHFQIAIADEVTCGNPDYFYDFYVPFADIANALGIDVHTGLRYTALTNVSATCAMGGRISDVSGVNDADYNSCYPCMFAALINAQCPTAIIDLCETCPGFSVDLVHAPTIDQPLRTGQQSVSGTTIESNIFVDVKVFSNIAASGSPPAWGTVPREEHGVYAVGKIWQVALNSPLQSYDKVVARAQLTATSVPCGVGGNNQTSTSVTVVQPNTSPTAQSQNVDVLEDTPKSIVLVGTDPENDPLTYTIIALPTHGTLSGTAPNVTYSPSLNYNGPDAFTFIVNDGIYNSPSGTVAINVIPVNDPPIANSQNVTLQEDASTAITLTGSDVDGNTLTYSVVAQPTHGTLSGTAPNLTYTPAPNYNGSDGFTFRVNDGTVDSNIASISITVTPVNDPPVASNQTISIAEDTPTGITLSATDIDGNGLTFTILSSPTHGTLTGTAPNLTYTPALNYNGPDGFTFKVNDGTVDSNIATVSITVTPVNDAPIANNQSVTTAEDIAKLITLTGSDVDGNALTYSVVAGPAHGTLSGAAPNLTYTPALNYNGPDGFTFKVNDGTVDSNIATVSITVTTVNDAPIANDQTVTSLEDVAKTITLTGSDVDGNALTFILLSSPTHGTLSGSAPNLIYTPNLNYNGSDGFTFKVNDGSVDSNVGTVSITLTPVNDAPVANNQNATYDFNTPKLINLTATDVDGDALTFSIVSSPAHGVLSGTAPNVTYTPNSGYTGSDNFTFKVNDGTVDSNVATVSLIETPVSNSAPIANDQTISVAEDTPTGITLSAVDVDGNTLTFTLLSSPAHGTLSGTIPNLIYTPALNYNGSDSFTFKANDGAVDSNSGTISITVTPVNDAPIVNNQGVTTSEDVAKLITLTGSDVDGDPLTYSIIAAPSHGTLTGTAPNLSYTPALNYNGTDAFTFKANDGTVDSNVATVSITVTPVNDIPVANDQNITTDENVAKTITLTASDVDADALTYSVVVAPTHGALSGSAPNLIYTPDLNYNGTDGFTFKVNDGTVDSNPGTVSITVTPVNHSPFADDKSVTLPEDGSTAITLTGSDVDGNSLTFTVVAQPAHGTLSGTAPNLTYTPTLYYNGVDNFTFKVNDGTVDSNIATVSIIVTPVNHAPVANSQPTGLTLLENSSIPVTLTGSDVDGNALTYIIVTQPSHGTLSGTSPYVTYTPDLNYNGPDSFTFKVNDGIVDSNIATVSMTVIPINAPPVADDQSVIAQEDVAKTITLTGGDLDTDPLTYSITVSPIHGTLTGTAPNLTYTPALNYSGSDSFTFKANDGTIDSNIATVSITITPVNDAPVISSFPDLYTKEDSARLVCLNVVDVDSDQINFGQPSNSKGGGTMTRASAPFDFCYTFAPALNYNGESIWTLNVCDDGGLCGSTSVKIIITPVNDPPFAANDEIAVNSRQATSFNVTENDFVIAPPYKEFYDIYANDPSYKDALIMNTSPLSGPFFGTVQMSTDGTVSYTPKFDYVGPDSIKYKICDSGNLCTTAVAFISVGYPPFKIYEGVSPNGDNVNDYWRIDGIELFPDNLVRVYDRFNNVVFETSQYSNEKNNWQGQANHGLVHGTLPEGTYFYTVDLGNGEHALSGYVVLKRH